MNLWLVRKACACWVVLLCTVWANGQDELPTVPLAVAQQAVDDAETDDVGPIDEAVTNADDFVAGERVESDTAEEAQNSPSDLLDDMLFQGEYASGLPGTQAATAPRTGLQVVPQGNGQFARPCCQVVYLVTVGPELTALSCTDRETATIYCCRAATTAYRCNRVSQPCRTRLKVSWVR